MKYLYLVDYWVPFPSSEYGGTVSVIAETDTECHDILRDKSEQMHYDDLYTNKILEAVVKAPRFALKDEDEEPRIVESFTT
jgi:hypothetical protein